MTTQRKTKAQKARSQRQRIEAIHETLLEEEEKHLLECPNADFSVRAAAFSLDVIFFFLASSGLRHLFNAMNAHLAHLSEGMLTEQTSSWKFILFQLSHFSGDITANLLLLSKLALFYFYFIWSVAYSGGSPAKLLLGLRVIDEDTGRALTFPHAFFREVVGKAISALPLLYGFAMAFFRKDKKSLHDLASRSAVKKVHGVR